MRQVQQALIEAFRATGVPRWIKVDNGRPLGDPKRQVVPVLALWLIGHGIQVIYNPPRSPRKNAKVERCQGTLARWTRYQRCRDGRELQKRLDEQVRFYNYDFPIRRQQGRKRIESFPGLAFSGRRWEDQPFDFQKVLAFLGTGRWVRHVNKVGQVSLYGQVFSVGIAHRYHEVHIRLEATTNEWIITDEQGELLKRVPTRLSGPAIQRLDLSAGQGTEQESVYNFKA